MRKELYQTVEDRDNPDYVLENGPFKCISNAWLGDGYYFWDTFIEYAHWWGEQGYNGHYIVTKYLIDFNQEEIFDLLDPSYIRQLEDYSEIMRDRFGISNLTVPRIIKHMQQFAGFDYKGVRAESRGCVSHTEENQSFFKRLFFIGKSKAYLALRPPVQICLFSKELLLSGSDEIVFPEMYIETI